MDQIGTSRTHPGGFRRSLRAYLGAALFVSMAFAIRFLLSATLKDYSCYLLFAPAAMFASWFGGFGAGLAAFTAGLLLGDYFFLEPIGQIGTYGVVELVQVVSYSLTTLIGIALIEIVQRSRIKAQLAAEEARLRNAQLEKEITERKRIQQTLEETREQLSVHSKKLEELVNKRTATLEQTVSALEGFCYTIAHDLRAPLRAMEGFARALLEDYGQQLEGGGIDYAERICAAAQRMDRLIQDLLAYERLATLEVHTSPLACESLVEEVMRRLDDEVQKVQAQVTVDKPMPTVRGNSTLLEQVLEHIISNALKFHSRELTDSRPVVQVWSETNGTKARLWIADNGIGIASDYIAQIFEPFTRLHGQDSYPGNGIGLAFTKRAVERMGGKVGVESVLGSGSKFWIELDRA